MFQGGDDWIGTAKIPIASLGSGEPVTVGVELSPDGLAAAAGTCQLTLRQVVSRPRKVAKTIFLVRHGESLWNEGQRTGDLGKMMHNDHPLTKEGMQQAMELNARWHETEPGRSSGEAAESAMLPGCSEVPAEKWDIDDTDDELAPDPFASLSSSEVPWPGDRFYSPSALVLCSPLTRAVQTALLVLQGHPALKQGSPMHLCRNVREVKGVLGFDTVGCAVGPEIQDRVFSTMSEVLEREEAVLREEFRTTIDYTDCAGDWWTHRDNNDSKNETATRFFDVMQRIQYCEEDVLIMVGHSLFWRSFCKHYCAEDSELAQLKPELVADMRRYKLCNSGCLALQMDFSHQQPKVTDVELMFGSFWESKKEANSTTPVS